MGVCAVFVQSPGCHVAARLDGDVPDDGDSHVRVGLQAEGQDGDTDEEDGDDSNHLGSEGGVGLVKHQPDLGLSPLPPADSPIEVIILVAEPLRDLLIAGLLRVKVESVEDGECLLGVPVLGVGHPAAGLHLVTVQPPELQLLLEEGPAHISGVVELSCPVVVQDLPEHSRVPAMKGGVLKFDSF